MDAFVFLLEACSFSFVLSPNGEVVGQTIACLFSVLRKNSVHNYHSFKVVLSGEFLAYCGNDNDQTSHHTVLEEGLQK